ISKNYKSSRMRRDRRNTLSQRIETRHAYVQKNASIQKFVHGYILKRSDFTIRPMLFSLVCIRPLWWPQHHSTPTLQYRVITEFHGKIILIAISLKCARTAGTARNPKHAGFMAWPPGRSALRGRVALRR